MNELRKKIFAITEGIGMDFMKLDLIEATVLKHKSQYEMLQEFQRTFNSPHNDTPTIIPFDGSEFSRADNLAQGIRWVMDLLKQDSKETGSQVSFRASLLLEEIAELVEAKTLEDQLDALVDIHYLNTGNFVELGVDPEIPFKIVHEANMSKVWPDGTVHLNEFGKVVKPATFVSPEPLLVAEINRQRENAL